MSNFGFTVSIFFILSVHAFHCFILNLGSFLSHVFINFFLSGCGDRIEKVVEWSDTVL